MTREPNQWGLIAEGHLGGYVPGGDPLSACPDLWSWLIEEFGLRSMLDVGCGEGHALSFFRDRGLDVLGVDGLEQDDPQIVKHDYAAGPFVAREFDLVWSCEFVEHVEEDLVPNFLETFKGGRLLLMTHAVPGQPGWHHVNCQHSGYWIETLEDAGFDFDDDLTMSARALCADGTYFAATGLAFRRENRGT